MPRWEGDAPIEPRLDDRVLEVLAESAGRIAFNGLRRALKAHPESLTRALRRLEREGSIRRASGSYELAPTQERETGTPSSQDVHTVASVTLPPGNSREELFGQLSGRWFGRLRWVGLFDHPGDPWLVWSVEGSPGQVMLSAKSGHLRVLAGGSSRDPTANVTDAAYELLTHALRRLRELPQAEAPSVAFLAPMTGEHPVGPN